MLRKIYLIFAAICISTIAFAQTGTLKGVVTDVMSGEPIPFATIVISDINSDAIIKGTSADIDGYYIITDVKNISSLDSQLQPRRAI